VAAALGLALASAAGAARAQGDPEAGRALALRLCAGCHAVPPDEVSPVADAPTLLDLARRWPPEHLAEALAEGITVGHGSVAMPAFTLEPPDIDDLIAHLEDLRAPRPAN
jgi:cytochrome c